MKIQEILKQSEGKSLEFKKEIPIEEKGLINKQGSGPRVRYTV